jgi:hypothetical protein
LGQRGTGQVVALDDADAVVVWQRGGKRECHHQAELVWVGLTIHTHDGRPGRVIALGREKVRVRLADGGCHWMCGDEIVLRESKPEVDEALCPLLRHR